MKKQIIAILAISAAACLMTACKPQVYKEEMQNHGYKIDKSTSRAASEKGASSKEIKESDLSEKDRYYSYTVDGKEEYFFDIYGKKGINRQIIIRGEKTAPTKYTKEYKDEYGNTKTNTLYLSEVTIKKIYKEKINDKSEKLKVGDKIIMCEEKYYGGETGIGDVSLDYTYHNLNKGEYILYLDLFSEPEKISIADDIPNIWSFSDAFSTTQPEEFELREELRQEVLKTYN